MDDFYIGYLPKSPPPLKKWLLRVIILLFVAGLSLSLILISNYNTSRNSTFEYGIYKEITGRIYKDPVPTIKISPDNTSKTIVLVNFGKAGVSEIIERFEESVGGSVTDYEITIRGSLIYYDGITLLELSNEYQSIVDYTRSVAPSIRQEQSLGELQFAGELVDSKCFFGVMKPGFGKLHRSCAVRCISGGVPVALSTPDHQYFFIKGADFLSYYNLIGKPVRVSGLARRIDDIHYLELQDLQVAEKVDGKNQLSVFIAGMPQAIDYEMIKCLY